MRRCRRCLLSVKQTSLPYDVMLFVAGSGWGGVYHVSKVGGLNKSIFYSFSKDLIRVALPSLHCTLY